MAPNLHMMILFEDANEIITNAACNVVGRNVEYANSCICRIWEVESQELE